MENTEENATGLPVENMENTEENATGLPAGNMENTEENATGVPAPPGPEVNGTTTVRPDGARSSFYQGMNEEKRRAMRLLREGMTHLQTEAGPSRWPKPFCKPLKNATMSSFDLIVASTTARKADDNTFSAIDDNTDVLFVLAMVASLTKDTVLTLWAVPEAIQQSCASNQAAMGQSGHGGAHSNGEAITPVMLHVAAKAAQVLERVLELAQKDVGEILPLVKLPEDADAACDMGRPSPTDVASATRALDVFVSALSLAVFRHAITTVFSNNAQPFDQNVCSYPCVSILLQKYIVPLIIPNALKWIHGRNFVINTLFTWLENEPVMATEIKNLSRNENTRGVLGVIIDAYTLSDECVWIDLNPSIPYGEIKEWWEEKMACAFQFSTAHRGPLAVCTDDRVWAAIEEIALEISRKEMDLATADEKAQMENDELAVQQEEKEKNKESLAYAFETQLRYWDSTCAPSAEAKPRTRTRRSLIGDGSSEPAQKKQKLENGEEKIYVESNNHYNNFDKMRNQHGNPGATVYVRLQDSAKHNGPITREGWWPGKVVGRCGDELEIEPFIGKNRMVPPFDYDGNWRIVPDCGFPLGLPGKIDHVKPFHYYMTRSLKGSHSRFFVQYLTKEGGPMEAAEAYNTRHRVEWAHANGYSLEEEDSHSDE